MDVEHLDGGEGVEHGAWREAGSQGPKPGPERDVQAIGQERDEDMGLDALLQLVMDRPQLQIVLQIFEGRLDFDELNIELPQLCGVVPGQIGAEQVAALAPTHLVRSSR